MTSANAPIRVVIIDDNVDISLYLADLLHDVSDIELISTFTSGEEAIEQIGQAAPDVALVDLRLGGMSGVDCVRTLKELNPALLVMVFTGVESDESVFESLRAGADGYLLKPLSAQEMIEAIRNLHAGGSPMSPAIARRVVKRFHRTNPPTAVADGLSVRELQVLKMLVEGLRYKEIAYRLDLSVTTVRTYLDRIYEKMRVTSRTEAVVKFLQADRSL